MWFKYCEELRTDLHVSLRIYQEMKDGQNYIKEELY